MISLRKYIDKDSDELAKSTLAAYTAALVAISNAGADAFPPAGEALRQRILRMHKKLTADPTSQSVTETETQLEAELNDWGKLSGKYFEARTNDVQEVLSLVATTLQKTGQKDDQYGKHLKDLTMRLHASAQLQDIQQIRESLSRDVRELNTCVHNMEQDGHELVAQLRSKVASYEARLEEVEVLASQDALTGLANRRWIERQLQHRIADGRKFSVIYIDLNGFKQINDVHGHLAGDALLKLFAEELRMTSSSHDLIGRWGGDEFIMIMDEDGLEAHHSVKRVTDWVNGEYHLQLGSAQLTVQINAAAGLAEWRPGVSMNELLNQADAAMYAHKHGVNAAV